MTVSFVEDASVMYTQVISRQLRVDSKIWGEVLSVAKL